MTIKQKIKDLYTLKIFNKYEYTYLKLLIDIDDTKNKLDKLLKEKRLKDVSKRD